MVKRYKKYTHRYHHLFHAFFGITIGLGYAYFFAPSYWFVYSLVGAAASILPDLEHFFYFFWFGRNDSYAQDVKKHLMRKEFCLAVKYCANNHKTLNGLPLHNIFTPVVLLLFAIPAHQNHLPVLAVICLSLASHYLYDIFEDLVLLGRVNSNWFFKFNVPQPQEKNSKKCNNE